MGNYVFMQTIKQLWYYTKFHLNNIYSMYIQYLLSILVIQAFKFTYSE